MGYKSDITKADRTQEATEFPRVVLIDNCNACNLRCSMCDHQNMPEYRKTQLMDIALYHKIIDEIALENPQARVWEIFFGDPFMCFDMASRIRYAKEKGLQDVVLNSNGVRMTKTRAQAVIEAGLDAMYVGVDAATQKTYDRIRVGGDFTKAVHNVLQYRDLLEQFGHGAQKLFVQFVVSDINQHEVDDFIAFWKKAGITVKIRPKVSWAGLVEANNLQANENLARKPCYWLMQTINICADGEVALCSVDVHCQVKCGNVKDHPLKEIWQGRLKTCRDLHQESRFGELPELCKNCRDWQSGYAEFI
jgi:radical SAM protein with 4Fe4S-binding SPASM domain